MTVEPLAVDVTEAARLIGISRAKAYELVMAGTIQSFRVGTRRIVGVESLRDWMRQEIADSTPGAVR